LKADPRKVIVPLPALGQLGLDQIEPILLLVLMEQNRLLSTPITGATAEIVASSWIDPLAGLSRLKEFEVVAALMCECRRGCGQKIALVNPSARAIPEMTSP
jgi:hypothetical protein